MAGEEEVPKTAQETSPPQAEAKETATATSEAEEVVVVADHEDAPPPPSDHGKEKAKEKEAANSVSPPAPAEEEEDKVKVKVKVELNDDDDDKINITAEYSGSFKEESNRISDLSDPERNALDDLKHLVREALNNHRFHYDDFSSSSSSPKPSVAVAAAAEENKSKDHIHEVEEPKSNEKEKEKPAEETEEPVAAAAEIGPQLEVAVTDCAEDDGAKTVEAIEETIVAVSSSEQQPKLVKEAYHDLEKQTDDDPQTKTTTNKDDASASATDDHPLQPQEVFIWGVPLLADERSDVILLKFLRARDLNVRDAFTMLNNTIRWRKQFGIDQLLIEKEEEEQGNTSDLDKVVFMHGHDKEGHPVCYNVYGEFRNKELYQKTFSDEEKRNKFLRWRIVFLERSIRKQLDFRPGGVSTIVQVNDLKDSPGPTKWELRHATKQALHLLQDNYPEFVAKQVFINVPWWYLAVNRMISPFLTQRTKSKFVFAGPSKSAHTLLRYIGAEQIPVKFGGLSKDDIGEFGTTDTVTEITLKPAAKHTIEFPASESCVLNWEVRVVGWDVNYGAEFVPSAEQSYTVIIQKTTKLGRSAQGPLVVCNSFKIGEPGKVVLTLHNPTSKKKKLLYRSKTILDDFSPAATLHKCA